MCGAILGFFPCATVNISESGSIRILFGLWMKTTKKKKKEFNGILFDWNVIFDSWFWTMSILNESMPIPNWIFCHFSNKLNCSIQFSISLSVFNHSIDHIPMFWNWDKKFLLFFTFRILLLPIRIQLSGMNECFSIKLNLLHYYYLLLY